MSNEIISMQAQNQADIINAMKPLIHELDIEYLEEAAAKVDERGSMYDSAAVLIQTYTPLKGRLMREQAKSLRALCAFVKSLKECDAIKEQIAKEEGRHREILDLFA